MLKCNCMTSNRFLLEPLISSQECGWERSPTVVWRNLFPGGYYRVSSLTVVLSLPHSSKREERGEEQEEEGGEKRA